MCGFAGPSVASQLTSNVVTNLQAQIDSLSSRVTGNWNSTLSSATKTLLGLASTATPDDAFKKLQSLVQTAQSTANDRLRLLFGTYVGNGNATRNVTLACNPKVLFLYTNYGVQGAITGSTYTRDTWGGLIAPDYPLIIRSYPNYKTSLNGNVLSLRDYTSEYVYGTIHTNYTDETYYYVAFY